MFYFNVPIKEEVLSTHIFSQCPFNVLMIRKSDGQIVGCNDSAEKFYGYTSDILLTKNIKEINILRDHSVDEEMERAVVSERLFFVFKHVKADRTVVDVHVYTIPIISDGHEYLFSIILDQSNDNDNIQNYIEKLKLNETILESIEDLVYTVKINQAGAMVVDFINAACDKIFSEKAHVYQGERLDLLVHKRDLKVFYDLLNDDESYTGTYTVLHNHMSGKSIPIEITLNKIATYNGLILIAVGRDIREKTLLSENLHYTRNLFSNLFNNSHDAMFIINSDMLIKDFNDVAREHYQLNQSHVGLEIVRSVLPNDNGSIYEKLQEAIVVGYFSFQYEYVDYNKKTMYLRFLVNEIDRSDLQKDYFLILVDETDIVLTQKTTQLYRKIFQHTTEGVVITDDTGSIVWINNAFIKLSGYSQKELLGNNPRLIKSDRHNNEFYQLMWGQLVETGSFSGELWNKNKKGHIYPTHLNIFKAENAFDRDMVYIGIVSDLTKIGRAHV